LWILSLAACVAVGVLLVQQSQQSAAARVGRAQAVVARACDLIRDRFEFYVAGWTAPAGLAEPGLRRDLATAVGLALAEQDGVEGGIWSQDAGALAYAFPTYEGSGPKRDLPLAERPLIRAVNQQAAGADQSVQHEQILRSQTLLVQACPLGGPIAGLTAWAMLRVPKLAGSGPLRLGLAVLLGLMLAMALWLGRTLLVWARHVRGIEAALAGAGPDIPAVPPSGERELDRVIGALNEAGQRLLAARREQDALSARVARAERLAGLGRVAAGVAHEIRNPIAAARLQGENGLAGDSARRGAAIADMLGQLDRLDALVSELLAMTQRAEPRPERVALPGFLAEIAGRHTDLAAAQGVRLHAVVGEAGAGEAGAGEAGAGEAGAGEAGAGEAVARFDPAVVGRVLDNLLVNAIRHASPDGCVALRAARGPAALEFVVEDSGAGVAPALRETLFEPFATGRPEGTGLGLAIARELADAHGGALVLRRAGGERPGQGAAFALVLPQEAEWRES
jgi:signal transduction histidine kinase